MVTTTYWPPAKMSATNLIKCQQSSDPTWDTHKVQVLRFFETYVKAREAVPKFIADSNYETEVELNATEARPKRRRYKPAFLESSDDESLPVKRSKQPVPAPPPIKSSVVKSSAIKSPSSKAAAVKPHKGHKSAADLRKIQREETMERLKAARATAAAKMAQAPTSPRSPSTKWEVSPLKSQNKVTTPVGTPTKSSIDSPSTSFMDCGNFLDIHLEEGKTPTSSPSASQETPLKSPSPVKTISSPSELQRSKAFCISSSAVDKSASSSTRQCSSSASKERRSSKAPLSKDSSFYVPSDRPSLTAARIPLSKTDGRRNLFAEGKDLDDRLKVLQTSVSRVNIDIHEVSQKLDLVLMNLSRMQRAIQPSEKRIATPHNMPKLPLEDRDALNKFEAFLGLNDVNLAAVCDFMSNYVRTSVVDPEKKSAKNILSKMLTNTLAKEINLEGGNKKIAFRSLNLYKVFQATLQEAFPKSDLVDAEHALKTWLKDAKWRKQVHPVTGPSAA